MDQVLNYLAGTFGLQPDTFLLVLGVVVAVSNLVGRLIPDDAVGPLALVRSIAKVLGLYASNRVASGVTVNDTAEHVASQRSFTVPRDAAQAKLLSPAFVGLIAMAITALFALSACTFDQARLGVSIFCQSAQVAQQAIDQAAETGDAKTVQNILNDVNATCPAVVTTLDLSRAAYLLAKAQNK